MPSISSRNAPLAANSSTSSFLPRATKSENTVAQRHNSDSTHAAIGLRVNYAQPPAPYKLLGYADENSQAALDLLTPGCYAQAPINNAAATADQSAMQPGGQSAAQIHTREHNSARITPQKTNKLPELLLVRNLAIYAAEIVYSQRPVSHLGAWISNQVAAHLRAQQRLNAESFASSKTTMKITWFKDLSTTKLFTPYPECCDAVVLLLRNGKPFAVSLRLVRGAQKWRAVNISVL